MLTTNNVSFVGGIVKLCIGRHNMESLLNSHIYKDNYWRPHMRLFIKKELEQMLIDCGFEINDSYYFDNPGLRCGLKGKLHIIARNIVGVVPWFRSHILIRATKKTVASQKAVDALRKSFDSFGITHPASLIGRR